MPTDAEIVGYFHRHVIALVFTLQKGSDKHRFAVTAFVMSVLDHWFLITAGHCIHLIEEYTEIEGYILTQCQLIDYLGLKASHFEAIPFLYKDSNPTCLSADLAYDYGIMMLSPYYRQLLESNKIQALNEEVWKKQPFDVDFYKLLGIPKEFVKFDSENIYIRSTLLEVEPIDEKPEGFTEVDTTLFYGRITLGEELTRIEGMSGGPIFAFHTNEKGETRYWLTAIQSRWLPESHFIAACPTKLLGLFLEDLIIKANQEQT